MLGWAGSCWVGFVDLVRGDLAGAGLVRAGKSLASLRLHSEELSKLRSFDACLAFRESSLWMKLGNPKSSTIKTDRRSERLSKLQSFEACLAFKESSFPKT